MNNQIIQNNLLLLSRLSGIGARSSKRILIDLMRKKDKLLIPLINNLTELANNIVHCEICNNIDIQNPCNICASQTRDCSIICVIEDISSLWTIEKSNSYNGTYYVLGGNLSASNMNDDIHNKLSTLINKVKQGDIKEVILATSATIEGKITANYIKKEINPDVIISMLAQGIPVGGEIDYLDELTISTAINSRKTF